jgi:hypothetical protein
MTYPRPLSLWDEIIDRDRCVDVDGLGGRCQLIRDHPGQHMLQRDRQRVVWPIGAEPQTRPAWAPGGFPRDES